MNAKHVIKIAVLPGDGIGIEVMHAALPIFKVLNIPVQLSFGEIGWTCWREQGTPIPEKTWELIKQSDTVLLGAITSKPQREAQLELAKQFQKTKLEYISPIIQLRQKLDLFANVRPCISLQDNGKKFNFCIIRENTEGLYSGFDYYPIPSAIQNLLNTHQRWQNIPANELSCALRLQSEKGLRRLFEFAFNYADTHQYKRVTFADKPNVLRQSGAFARTLFEDIAGRFPHINADILNVDAVALWLIKRAEQFGVIVAENMFGDILSDVGAGVMGGLGFAPSENIGAISSYFEPVHGSGLEMNPKSANPSAMFLTISMLLDRFGFNLEAKIIVNAVKAIVNADQYTTYDVGGTATTTEMAKAIIDYCSQTNPNLNAWKKGTTTYMDELKQLSRFSTAEISDALDACGIEGALLNINSLAPGMKLIGPAYTIQYQPNIKPSTTFKNAANYIDAVPEHAVIIIDNNGDTTCTVWGEILTQVAQQKHIAGTVVHGAVRDIGYIRNKQYPVFCNAVSMRSGKNRVHKTKEQRPLIINNVTVNPGDIIVGDDNGVLVIPKDLLSYLLIKINNIRSTEHKIKSAVKAGGTLEQARADFHYDKPWIDPKDD